MSTADVEAPRILLCEDDASLRETLEEVLRAHGHQPVATGSGAQAVERLQEEDIDLVVTDLVMPGIDGRSLLESVGRTFPEIPVIAITAFGSVDDALALTRAGAVDYITKPFRARRLLDAIQDALEASRTRRQHARDRRRLGEHISSIVGASPPMRRLFERIARVAGSPAPVLITGETGTGKELVARAVHQASGRGSFIPLNCGAIPENLLESELFGYAAGAFTGAHADRDGLFQAAAGGTLFLDEIAELQAVLQSKLLRAIDTGEVRRLGDHETRSFDVRILAATHRDLDAEVAAGRFREDLFWRINVLHLHVPPLRERIEDIPAIVDDFLERKASREQEPRRSLDPEAVDLLRTHDWPGNVRQLLNVLERAATFTSRLTIRPADLPPEIRHASAAATATDAAALAGLSLPELERQVILETLERVGGNKTRAARELGIPRRTLYRRLARYGIVPERHGNAGP
ncbi:MAG: sigma-54-dependent transcriptional regulator [Longimicrobiales bacterium]